MSPLKRALVFLLCHPPPRRPKRSGKRKQLRRRGVAQTLAALVVRVKERGPYVKDKPRRQGEQGKLQKNKNSAEHKRGYIKKLRKIVLVQVKSPEEILAMSEEDRNTTANVTVA